VNRSSRLTVGLLLLAAACTDTTESPMEAAAGLADAAGRARVTSSADAGPGSFRQAVLDANADPAIGVIRFEGGLDPIELETPVTYSGSQALVIRAAGTRLEGSRLGAGESALVADGGGNLTIVGLTVLRTPGNGITIKVPDAATGTFTVRLDGVVIRENGLHGILVNDQAEYFTDPLSTSEEGSNAGLLVEVVDSRFEKNGFALIDSDGLRINEGGAGTLEARVRNTRFANNGADGLELDERGAGNAEFTVVGSTLLGNGSFSSEDFDDGMDVDEAGEGDLIGRLEGVVASRNFEQGLDLNENGAGDLRARLVDVQAITNAEEGIELEEDDDVAGGGRIEAEMVRVTANRNGANGGDAGLKLREKGEGDLTARLVEALAVANLMTSGEDAIDGILLQEDEAGSLSADLLRATARGNSGDGIQLEENEAGDLEGRIRRSTASGNGGSGADLAQVAPGSGTVTLTDFTAPGNAEGAVAAEGVTVGEAP
jgi:Right handed beta helix region